MIAKVYAALLGLYPHRFRDEFGEEMRSVFEEAAGMHPGQKFAFGHLLHELRDLPGSAFKAHASEWPKGWEAALKKKIFLWFGMVILVLGCWFFAMMFTGLLNPGTFIALAIVTVVGVYYLAPAIKRANYSVWIYGGILILTGLSVPPSIHKIIFPPGDADPYSLPIALTNLLLISAALVVTSMLIKSIQNLTHKNRDTNVEENKGLQGQPKKSVGAVVGILALIMSLLAKTLHSFYWFMIWDSTTDSLDWLWLPFPVMAVIFSSLLLFFTLPKRTKLAGFLYLLLIPAVIFTYALTRQVDFRQLTEERAERVNQLIETYHDRVGRYPRDLQELQPWYKLRIPGPVILYGEGWCYDRGDDYYRLGYVTRLHWSDPRLFGKIHTSSGHIPDLPGMCAAEVAAIQNRYPEYPYEYWGDGD